MARRDKVQREKDLATIAAMYCKKYLQIEIVEHLCKENDDDTYITQVTVSNDLKEIFKRWRDSSIRDFDELRADQLAQIEFAIEQAYRGWERSISKSVKQIQSKESSLRSVKFRKKKDDDYVDEIVDLPHDKEVKKMEQMERDGNPIFLQLVRGLLQDRAKLLDLLVDRKDITSGGEKIQGNVLVLPDNGRDAAHEFDEDKLNLWIQAVEAEQDN